MNINIDMKIFSKYILCVCVCLYMHNKYTQNTHKTFILYAIDRD